MRWRVGPSSFAVTSTPTCSDQRCRRTCARLIVAGLAEMIESGGVIVETPKRRRRRRAAVVRLSRLLQGSVNLAGRHGFAIPDFGGQPVPARTLFCDAVAREGRRREGAAATFCDDFSVPATTNSVVPLCAQTILNPKRFFASAKAKRSVGIGSLTKWPSLSATSERPKSA